MKPFLLGEIMLTQERLKEVLIYDPDTGNFIWAMNRMGPVRKGEIAGTIDNNGYVKIWIDRKQYRAQRLAFLYMAGNFPDIADHKNGIVADNRWCNLRNLSKTANGQNISKPRSHNKCGFLGVQKHTDYDKFVARIVIKGKEKYLGIFDTPELAHAAYLAAKRIYHEGNTL